MVCCLGRARSNCQPFVCDASCAPGPPQHFRHLQRPDGGKHWNHHGWKHRHPLSGFHRRMSYSTRRQGHQGTIIKNFRLLWFSQFYHKMIFPPNCSKLCCQFFHKEQPATLNFLALLTTTSRGKHKKAGRKKPPPLLNYFLGDSHRSQGHSGGRKGRGVSVSARRPSLLIPSGPYCHVDREGSARWSKYQYSGVSI